MNCIRFWKIDLLTKLNPKTNMKVYMRMLWEFDITQESRFMELEKKFVELEKRRPP